MFWIIFLSSIPVLILFVYLYIKWKYFKLHGPVVGLEPEFIYGNLRQLGVITSNKEMIDSYMNGCQKLQKIYGDIFQFWIGTNHCYVFCRPEHAEQIYTNRHLFDRANIRTKTFGLIAENAIIALIGPKYKRHAKAILPMLKKHRFISQISLMTNCMDQLISIWKQRYENQDELICRCIVDDTQQLMLDLFTLLTFNYDFGNLKRLLKSSKLSIQQETNPFSDFSLALSIWLDAFKRIGANGMPDFINYYLLKFDKKYQNALKTLENHAEKIIEKYQDEVDLGDKPTNLIASLVSSLQKNEVIEKHKSEEDKIGISKKELLDNVISLVLGGFDTTASVISWFIYHVSKKPESQQKIKEELIQNGITKDTDLNNIDLLNQCIYIDCVIKETLRIQPLAIGSFRTLTDDTILDGIQLRKGETVLTPFSLMQKDSRYWKLDPDLFIPERFYGEDAVDIHHHPFAFSPFGGGHRVCAGQELARLELKVLLIRLMQFVTFIDAPGNNGGHQQRLSVMPKELAVYIKFD